MCFFKVEESPEIKRQTQEAEDSFVAQKLKLLRTNTSEKSGDISRPSKKEKLGKDEAMSRSVLIFMKVMKQ